MGVLKAQLAEDLRAALKGSDRLRTSVLRLLHALIKNREIEKRGELDDAEIVQAVIASCKTRKEAIEQYTKAGRPELAAKEQAELAMLEAYLPAPLSPEELRKKVQEALAAAQAGSLKDMGKVMAILMPQIAGRADGKLASQLVKEALSQH
ncbi:MAG: glutamyl-tRNA amidotransferase [Candidatus Methylomirabilota bacterium]|nr:GatB/YqeY domain-containing protein [Candidatus Methylomirabilis sp.]NJD67599.1 GatB/YqeY domain-containing protein [candidate division NC10 bacterium]PWB42810.1 MAG: glutamyl-tRNA amidotransferase [candidate division NC10 bacterium]